MWYKNKRGIILFSSTYPPKSYQDNGSNPGLYSWDSRRGPISLLGDESKMEWERARGHTLLHFVLHKICITWQIYSWNFDPMKSPFLPMTWHFWCTSSSFLLYITCVYPWEWKLSTFTIRLKIESETLKSGACTILYAWKA